MSANVAQTSFGTLDQPAIILTIIHIAIIANDTDVEIYITYMDVCAPACTLHCGSTLSLLQGTSTGLTSTSIHKWRGEWTEGKGCIFHIVA